MPCFQRSAANTIRKSRSELRQLLRNAEARRNPPSAQARGGRVAHARSTTIEASRSQGDAARGAMPRCARGIRLVERNSDGVSAFDGYAGRGSKAMMVRHAAQAHRSPGSAGHRDAWSKDGITLHDTFQRPGWTGRLSRPAQRDAVPGRRIARRWERHGPRSDAAPMHAWAGCRRCTPRPTVNWCGPDDASPPASTSRPRSSPRVGAAGSRVARMGSRE